MAQVQGQYQMQTEAQLLKLSPLQLETAKLLELSITQLEERVNQETCENYCLEEGEKEVSDDMPDPNTDAKEDYNDSQDEDNYNDEENFERDGYQETEDYDSDDIPLSNNYYQGEEKEITIGDTTSFIDDLLNQMADMNLDEHMQTLVEYLIGSLNDNGFIENSLYDIADDMLFHHNIYTDEAELEKALSIVQSFDPPGIGARNSQESLLLQIDRKMNDKEHLLGEKYFILEEARIIIAEHYDLFKNNNIEKIQNTMSISSARMRLILQELRKLNLRPGLALCEAASDRIASAIPDFIVETTTEGDINFRLNKGELPTLHVSKLYRQQLKELESPEKSKRRSNQESAKFIKSKIDSAQLFIDAIRLRQHTLTVAMQAIIALQHDFFLSQDPEDLKRLILKDVADKAGLDISTISRVCNNKYCLLDGRLYQLSRFFKRSRTNTDGDDIDPDKVRNAIKTIIGKENKKMPYTDENIAELLAKIGIKIKRRTVAKYRDEMGIPVAKNRKSI